ncbi:unnamed protein product [Brassicogethes aeneus]|uniref:Uncharacterized protein n=1 Tax=Brassicogethes aeneus TaxID=1431903 RepID=A0A9P0BB68_BRAAE|nr:unnamed protein product [Brassicogethes aeneus]
MKARTLNAKLNIKSALRKYGGRVDLVPISAELLRSAYSANSKYKEHLTNEKKKEEIKKIQDNNEKEEEIRQQAERRILMQKQHKKLNALKTELTEAKKENKLKKNATDKLLKETNERLKKALRNKNLAEIAAAQGMLEGAHALRKDTQNSQDATDKLQCKINKRKSELTYIIISPSSKEAR